MSAVKSSDSPTADREIIITRVFDAPRALVFEAFTDAKHIDQWWGPNGFTNATREMDVRTGGAWRYVMHGPDGTDYSNKIVYSEVVKPERLAYAHGEDDDNPPHFHVTITFEDQGGKTLVTLRSIFPTAAVRDHAVKKIGAIEGGKQTLARLADYLARTFHTKEIQMSEEFVISRVFAAPRDLVFKAHTDCEHLKHWWGPKGFTMHTCKLDLRPGGVFHYGMRSPGGDDMWGRFVFREIVAPERLVWVNSFSDAQGGLTRHPMAPDWPMEMLVTSTFTEEDGKTILTLRSVPHEATPAERAVFLAGHRSMQGGFGGTFDQLDRYLAEIVRAAQGPASGRG